MTLDNFFAKSGHTDPRQRDKKFNWLNLFDTRFDTNLILTLVIGDFIEIARVVI